MSTGQMEFDFVVGLVLVGFIVELVIVIAQVFILQSVKESRIGNLRLEDKFNRMFSLEPGCAKCDGCDDGSDDDDWEDDWDNDDDDYDDDDDDDDDYDDDDDGFDPLHPPSSNSQWE